LWNKIIVKFNLRKTCQGAGFEGFEWSSAEILEALME
jgi:hypothetical protein